MLDVPVPVQGDLAQSTVLVNTERDGTQTGQKVCLSQQLGMFFGAIISTQ